MYIKYSALFLFFAALAFLDGYLPAALGSRQLPPMLSALIVFLLMTVLGRKLFWRRDKPYRSVTTEQFVATGFYGSTYIGLGAAYVANELTIIESSALADGVAALGDYALFVLLYILGRVLFFERSDPKNCRKGGGCCGGHHH